MDYLQTSMLATIEPGTRVAPACPYPELAAATALYRQGISDSNPFHQFLALWKVYENVVTIRGRWRREHKRADIKLEEERFPDVLAFQRCAGKTFEEVRQELRPSYRDAIAHSDGARATPKTGASSSEFVNVSCQVVLVRHMARVVLENMRATLGSTSTLMVTRQNQGRDDSAAAER